MSKGNCEQQNQDVPIYQKAINFFDTSENNEHSFMVGTNLISSTANRQAFVRTNYQGEVSSAQTFEDYKQTEPPAFDINSILLPPPNLDCYIEPSVPRGTVTYLKHEEPTVTRTITLNFNSVKTVVRENIIHHQHNKTVITNVNRNHWHTQRILVKDNNYHHYLINNIVKINDIHHQKIEQVRTEGKSFNDFKQVQRVEAANCEFPDKDANISNLSNTSHDIQQQTISEESESSNTEYNLDKIIEENSYQQQSIKQEIKTNQNTSNQQHQHQTGKNNRKNNRNYNR